MITQKLSSNSRVPRLPAMSIISIEAWERFSFYGMQAILAYYFYATLAEGGLGIDKGTATSLIGAYAAFVYLCTFAGGWISDRLLGPEKTLLGGAFTLIAGHLTLSLIQGPLGTTVGLLLIALGSGVLKTAAITILGMVHADNPGAREASFQYFYAGINVAAIGGPLISGWLARHHSYHAGFLAAAILMIIGVCLYLVLRKRMLTHLNPDVRSRLATAPSPLTRGTAWLPIAASCGACLALALVVQIRGINTIAPVLFIVVISIAVALFATMYRSRHTTPQEKKTMTAYIPLFLASCMFWTIQNQVYGVLAVYSDERLNRTVFGFEIPPAWTQSFNPIFIIALAIPVAAVLTRLGNRTNTATTMSIGVAIAGLGLWVLLPFSGGGNGTTPLLILAASILISSFGELLVGPIGMSATGEHAPAAYATRFSALYFLTLSIGASLAGVLSQYYSINNELPYFLGLGGGAMVIGLITYVVSRYLRVANMRQ